MKVLVVGTSWPPETFLLRLINGLSDQGMTIIIASDKKPPLWWLSEQNHEWLRAPSWNTNKTVRFINLLIFFGKYLFLPQSLKRWVNKNVNHSRKWVAKMQTFYQLIPFARRKWDIIYFPWNSAAIVYSALSDLGSPIIISCRGSQINIRPYLDESKQYSELLKQSFEKSAAIHCVSQNIMEEAMQFGLNPAKVKIIRPAVDSFFFIPPIRHPTNRQFVIITTGSLIWRKGYEYALMAFRNLTNRGVDAEFRIIGAGPERQRILYTSQDLGLENKVTLLGKLPPEIVREQLQASDVFFLSSLSEGISNAVLEAMSCGLPIVTTDCGGMREAVTDGVEGFVTPVRDPEAAAEALWKLAKDSELRYRMGNAARDRILLDFELRDQISAFSKMFSETLGESH